MNVPYTIVNLACHRASKNTRAGNVAHAILTFHNETESALNDIRASRERLDAISHSGVFYGLRDRLRNVCYGIDSASAEVESDA